MILADIKDFLKEKIECHNWYIGKRDAAAEYSITVYPTQGPAPVIPIGGLKYGSYASKSASVLVHWGKSYSPAENKAQEVFDCLFGKAGEIGGKQVVYFDLRTSEPTGLGTDDAGCYEFVINFVVYYRKG